MALNLDAEYIESRHDPASRMNFYTIERGGRRWTVPIHMDDFDRLGPVDDEMGKRNRREHLSNCLELAMQGPADGEN